MYQQYSKNGPLYIMIKKSNPSEKYQFHFESKQFMDKDDHRINIKEFFNGKNELINYYLVMIVVSSISHLQQLLIALIRLWFFESHGD